MAVAFDHEPAAAHACRRAWAVGANCGSAPGRLAVTRYGSFETSGVCVRTMWVDVAEDFTVTMFPADQCDAATGTRRIAAVGPLTSLGGELLEAAVIGLFTGVPANRPRRVCVDLSSVTGSDAAGIAAVVDARRIAWRHDTEFSIDTGQGAVKDVLAFQRHWPSS